MFEIIKSRIIILIALLFSSFYCAFIITVGYQIICAHSALICEKTFIKINFGIITFIISALLPLLLWKMNADSKIPLLQETLALRLIISQLAFVFTICLFISKSIFNSIAKPVINIRNDALLDLNGRIVLIEIISVAVPILIFLYLSKKVINYFYIKFKE